MGGFLVVFPCPPASYASQEIVRKIKDNDADCGQEQRLPIDAAGFLLGPPLAVRCQSAWAFPTKFFLRIGAPIPIRRRCGPQTDTTRGEQPTDVEQSGAVYLTGDNVTA